MNKIAIYTCIFGDNTHKIDNLKRFSFKIPSNCKLFCFTNMNFSHDQWNIIKVDDSEMIPSNFRKSARQYKILSHLTKSRKIMYIMTKVIKKIVSIL